MEKKTIEIPEGYEARIEGNKVFLEPKFKAGDFITDGERIFQIKETVWERNNRNDGSTYCESLIVNLRNGYTYANSTDLKEYHLWTIQDAKDGDVLAEHETIVLFKKIEGQNIRCYCTYHYLGYNTTFYVDTLQNKTPYHPTTKEQRDLLFAKMKEAGYKWDADKKELKKIEQKSAWSEEDEKFLKTALWHISYSVSNGKNTDEHCDTTDWLKSLKERYTWKPTDAQMESLDLLSRGEGSRHIILRSLYNSLQKLLN